MQTARRIEQLLHLEQKVSERKTACATRVCLGAVGMSEYCGGALAGAHLLSLTLMGASRKVFGPEVVAQRLVPHRGDIGAAAFFLIGIGGCVQLGMIGGNWGPGGESHKFPIVISQLGYLSSLIARNDLPPKNPHRLLLLMLVWVGLASCSAITQVLLEVASLWIVKLRLNPSPPVGSSDDEASVAAPFLKRPTRVAHSPAKAKPNKAAGKGKAASNKGGGQRKGGKR